MFEVTERAGLARLGILRTRRGEIRTPNILFLRGERSVTTTGTEVYLSTEEAPDTILHDSPPKDATSPPTLSKPFSLQTWEMPIQGDPGEISFLADPLQSQDSAKDVVALQNAVEFLRYPKRFVADLAKLREVAGYQKALYAPLLATPATLPLLAYVGVDFVDVLRVLYDTQRGRFLRPDGTLPSAEMEVWPCLCPACEKRDLEDHNLRQMVTELRMVRTAIHRGTLRELVERRLPNDPWMTAVLRELDLRYYEWQERHAPVSAASLKAYSAASLHRPEVMRFRRRLRDRYRRPPSAPVLLLLPCSARKPYSTSRSHRLFRSVIRASGNPWAVHVVVVTSPLGLVPLELQLLYPAQHYDVPVTGDWTRDEAAILEEDLPAFLAVNRYDAVVSHLGAEAGIVNALLDDALVTSEGEPRSAESLRRLEATLKEVTADLPRVPGPRRTQEELRSMARFQFGPGAEALVEGARTRGRYPHWRLIKDGRQVAALTGRRGMMALALEGGQILSDHGLGWVEIDDFYPEGNVFAVGVDEAHEELRVGDEAAVRHAGEVRAVGVARMNPGEMRTSNRGEAVRVRHRRKPG